MQLCVEVQSFGLKPWIFHSINIFTGGGGKGRQVILNALKMAIPFYTVIPSFAKPSHNDPLADLEITLLEILF